VSDELSTDTGELATELTIAWLGNPNTRVTAEEVPAFLKSMFDAVTGLTLTADKDVPESAAPEYVAAVTARKSLGSPEHIISMIDGKPYKTLRRHLSTHGLTPEQYRERYGLKPDYPMVAPAYSTARREMAKKIGLGRKPGQTVPKHAASTAAAATTPKAPRAGRAKSGAALRP
jgi:predicted transcriptional regulator